LNTRVLPDRERFASCPGDGRILKYYEGKFDSVYVSLSPFLRPISISRETLESDDSLGRRQIVGACEPVTWREVMRLAGLPSLSAVDIGLRTLSLGLNPQYQNRDYAKRISELALANGIVAPADGEHSDLLHNQVLRLFQELGHKWVWIGDEFCTERKLYWVEDLLTESVQTIRGHCNVFSPDQSLLWTVHWESHFSLICSSRENLDRVNVAGRLEGFLCTPGTEMYWSVHGM